jgi:hypothetical protein
MLCPTASLKLIICIANLYLETRLKLECIVTDSIFEWRTIALLLSVQVSVVFLAFLGLLTISQLLTQL